MHGGFSAEVWKVGCGWFIKGKGRPRKFWGEVIRLGMVQF